MACPFKTACYVVALILSCITAICSLSWVKASEDQVASKEESLWGFFKAMVLPADALTNACESSCGDEGQGEISTEVEKEQVCETKLECSGGVCHLRRRCVPKTEVDVVAAEHVKAA